MSAKGSVFPSLTSPIHYTRVYSSPRGDTCTLCKALILPQDFFSPRFIHTAPYMVFRLRFLPPLTLTSPPFLSLEISLEQRNCILSTAGHLAEADPMEQNPAWTSILSLNCHPAFIQTAPNPHGSSLWNCIISPLLTGACFTFPGEAGPMEGASHKSVTLAQEPKLKLETDVAILLYKKLGPPLWKV